MNNHVSQIVSDIIRVTLKAQQSPMQRYEYAKRLIQCKQLQHQDYEQAIREIARRVGI